MGTALLSGYQPLPGLTRALAAGDRVPPALTVSRAFTQWTLDPWMLALIVVLGGGYLAGLYRVRHLGHSWPKSRAIWFLGFGLGFLAIASMSWTGAYQGVLFYARSVQVVLFVLVAPLFLALGRPITLAITALPGPGKKIEAAIRSRAARVITFPAITTLVLVGVPMVMYFTSWYTATFRSTTARELTYLALMAPGFVFFWTLLRVDPVPKAYSYTVSLWITTAEVIGDAILGLAVIADENLIGGPYYHALAAPWASNLQTNQVLGGGVLWVLGDIVGLPFLVAQIVHLMREDEAEAVRIDADLDAGQALAAAEPDAAAPAQDRPWWEDDPRFTGRFKAT